MKYPQAPTKPSSPRAFTLVELLSVVAIIGVLMSLIVMGIGGVRRKANEASCLNNLRQLATAYLLFASDNKGYPIPASVSKDSPWSEGGHSNPGIEILRQYYRAGPRYSWTVDHKRIEEKVEVCPTALQNEWSDTGYGLTDYMSNKPIGNYYQMPAKTPMLWDGPRNWLVGRTLPLRHRGGLHAAFLDGHVDRIEGTDTDGRLYSEWLYTATRQPAPDDTKLRRGTPVGVEPGI